MTINLRNVVVSGKYYIATMTMITASTALTIFIMNIHFCGAEAKPVPRWAKVLIIDYMSKIFFVYEVGENCASSQGQEEDMAEVLGQKPRQKPDHRNQYRGGQKRPRPNGKPREPPGPGGSAQHSQQQTTLSWEQNRISFSQTLRKQETFQSNAILKGAASSCSFEDEKQPLTINLCVFCGRHSCGNFLEDISADSKLVSNVEYIANCFREQRSTCLKVAEWKKVAKVMDRFFMWIFFAMVFLMSILIIGKSP